MVLGPGISVDVAEPTEALGLDPGVAGLVAVDPEGRVRGSWGLARGSAELRPGTDLHRGPFASALGKAPASARHEALRVVSTPEAGGGWRLLAVDAAPEWESEEAGERMGRLAQGLKRLGKALSMNQNVSPLCAAAIHEIASTAELAAVLLWRYVPEGDALELAASLGVNRQGTAALNRLAVEGVPGCAAELVAMNRRPFYAPSVSAHVLTGEIEGRFCYLRPGGVRVLALEISGRLLGVLEMVGREGDARFEGDEELHVTASEHLTLALNGAMLYENLERLASHDPLTGLANHRALQDFLHWRIAECDRTAGTLGCIMVDVDHFRDFNEQEGHDAGDVALRQVADALRASVRPYDLAARYGGEEFTILVPGASAAGVMGLAERLRKRVASRPFVCADGREAPLTVSVGCAVYPAQGPDAPGLLKAADVALYEAKRAGRNRVEGPGAGAMPSALADLRAAIGEKAYAAGSARLADRATDLDGLSMTLRLSVDQRTLLESLVVAADAWSADPTHPAFVPLAPFLEAASHPHDPALPAPLLARVLQVLLVEDESSSLDPEIVDLVGRMRG